MEVKDATEQVLEYVDRQRMRQRCTAALKDLKNELDSMLHKHGAEATVGALMRYTGDMLVEGYDRPLIWSSCRYLAKCIARSVWRRMLTRPAILH